MDEPRSDSSWAATLFIALLTLLTLAALFAPRFKHPTVGPKATPSMRPIMPTVELWLSTADRRLKLMQQPGMEMSARGSLPTDVVIDVRRKYQAMAGFGAALTDSSAWLLQNKLNELQRNA